MIRIAFCDNEPAFLEELLCFTRSFQQTTQYEIKYNAFSNSFDLLTKIECGTRYDILFINTHLTDGSGIEIAREIRKFDTNIKIIFLSFTAEYALAAYSVDASYYQIKPISQQLFCTLLEKLITKIDEQIAHSLILKCKNGIHRVRFSKIEYCEVCNRIVTIHLTNGKILESTIRFKDLEDALKLQGNFIRPHRFFIVNINYIASITCSGIEMESQNLLPISHGKMKSVKNQFLEHFEQI